MNSILEFFDTITDPTTWQRVVYVILGAVLVYQALMMSPINRVSG